MCILHHTVQYIQFSETLHILRCGNDCVLGDALRCVGCENIHMIHCSRSHAIFCHPTPLQCGDDCELGDASV